MKFDDIEDIKRAGFTGFRKMSDLFQDSSMLPDNKGVYLVLYLENNPSEFLTTGSGGRFKKKNPNVPVAELKSNWVEDTLVVYIGKAGSSDSRATLKSRLRQYLRFGQGKNVGHYGGRLIWQLTNSKDLVVCWKSLQAEEPREIEANLIQLFLSVYGKRPFANLKD